MTVYLLLSVCCFSFAGLVVVTGELLLADFDCGVFACLFLWFGCEF